MIHTQIRLIPDQEYDAFLQSIVGDDVRGDSVTVLSMLARLGVDPFKEASDLSTLSKESAWQRLDSLMARFYDVPSLNSARAEIVSRLIAVLPQEAAAGRFSPDAQAAQIEPKVYGIPVDLVILTAIALLLAQFGIPDFGN